MKPGFRLVALTGETFHSFSPYVAAIDAEGNLTFQTALSGGEALLCWRTADQRLETVCQTGSAFRTFCSHPVLHQGSVSAFAETVAGTQGLWRFGAGESLCLVSSGPEIQAIGPLGPTVNAYGEIALRAVLTSGEAAVLKADADGWKVIAKADELISGFQGLPLIETEGALVFRADLTDGRQALFRSDGRTLMHLVVTGQEFQALGRFPSLGPDGEVVFAATDAQGDGLFALRDGQLSSLVGPDTGFASVRGGLLSERGPVCFATPPGGSLGLYFQGQRLLGLGDEFMGAEVKDFALNPVSINALGQLALRVSFSDGREGIFVWQDGV